MRGPDARFDSFQKMFRRMSFRIQHDEGRRQAFLDHIPAGIFWIAVSVHNDVQLHCRLVYWRHSRVRALLEARVKSLRGLLKPA
jgi:hypothetical protein